MANPVGRPSSYDKKYCKYVIEEASKGRAMVQISFGLGFTKSTFCHWAEVHPEFKQAYELAKNGYESWLLSEMSQGLHNPRFNGKMAEGMLKSICHVEHQVGICITKKDIAGAAVRVMQRSMTADERDRYTSSIERVSKIYENTDVAAGLAEIQEHLKLSNKTKIKVTGG